jgi:hypothetical protein
MTDQQRLAAIGWFLCAIIVGMSGWIYTVRYQECRAHGFSVFYCALGR